MNPTRQPVPDTTTDPMNPAALLRSAAVYLKAHGWTQGAFFQSFDFMATDPKPFPAACASGAISVCAHGRPVLGSDDSANDCDTDAAITAMRVFAAYLDPEYGTNATTVIGPSAIDVIGDWNDDKGRTIGEVIEALTDAAGDWEAAHPTGGAR